MAEKGNQLYDAQQEVQKDIDDQSQALLLLALLAVTGGAVGVIFGETAEGVFTGADTLHNLVELFSNKRRDDEAKVEQLQAEISALMALSDADNEWVDSAQKAYDNCEQIVQQKWKSGS